MLDMWTWTEVLVTQKTAQDIQIQGSTIKQILPIHFI